MHSLKLVALLALFGLALSQTCGEARYDTYAYGTLYSPSSNGLYLPNSYCVWTFTSYYGYYGLKFTFEDFYIEQGYDNIYIYENGYLAATYTGNVTGTYTTSTTDVTVYFITDAIVEFPSFYIPYQWINEPETCGGTAESYSGVINGPSDSTGSYPANANCTWYFPQLSSAVILDFSNLYLESGYDNIYIYAGYSNQLYATLTGSLGYYDIVVPAPATVVFASDYNNQYSTFSIAFEYTWDSPSDSDSDSDSDSGSGSPSSSTEPHHGGIVVFLIVTAFLLGCIGGLVLGICVFTRSRASQQKQAEIPMNQFGYAPVPLYPQMMQYPTSPQVPQQI